MSSPIESQQERADNTSVANQDALPAGDHMPGPLPASARYAQYGSTGNEAAVAKGNAGSRDRYGLDGETGIGVQAGAAVEPRLAGAASTGACEPRHVMHQLTPAEQHWHPNPAHARADWTAAHEAQKSQPLDVDANGMHSVKYGETLADIAGRYLRGQGKNPSADEIRDEVRSIIASNLDAYPGLAQNPDLLRAGDQIRMTPCGQGQTAAIPERQAPATEQARHTAAPQPIAEQALQPAPQPAAQFGPQAMAEVAPQPALVAPAPAVEVIAGGGHRFHDPRWREHQHREPMIPARPYASMVPQAYPPYGGAFVPGMPYPGGAGMQFQLGPFALSIGNNAGIAMGGLPHRGMDWRHHHNMIGRQWVQPAPISPIAYPPYGITPGSYADTTPYNAGTTPDSPYAGTTPYSPYADSSQYPPYAGTTPYSPYADSSQYPPYAGTTPYYPYGDTTSYYPYPQYQTQPIIYVNSGGGSRHRRGR